MTAALDYRGITRWMSLVRAEYREMPGLSLTKKQMERLWGFDSVMCNVLVDALVDSRVLRVGRDGSYVAFQSAH